MVTVRSIIALAASKGWNMFQMDAHNAFLQGDLEEEEQTDIVIVLVYVDDLLITGSNITLIEKAKQILNHKFKMKDLGELKYFLGIEIMKSTRGVLLNQRKYVLELSSEMGLSGSKPTITLLEVNRKLTTREFDEATNSTRDELLSDANAYQRLIEKLLYVTITRLDICFSVQTLWQFMQMPKRSHWEAALRTIKYLKNSPGQGILLQSGVTQQLTCWCDSDWASCPNTRRSVTGFAVKFGNLLSPGNLRNNKQ
ncbi:uncharacterized mitochondrial protein AtMg00810-like [Solanum verrucosum]|uniref:uncharacterized mitochondrial protein AtMg00810-like n=1 Tax=Solanum verrucosum TaxID=315347 RepID=UPI0020D0C638|nr:uncharacterized mitochondrial protein AtMg00810-like [Solanum verrucosum]